ncbi:MAG: hypothetical protein LBH82_04735 [Bacteroidales bacterium]|jgi:trigger factor|nr:hypothetical protein [Bacteroidales bacterium]
MEIKREKLGNLNELITIELTSEDYREEVEKSLKTLKKTVTVPGFRRGNVPMGMLNKMYGKAVLVEETGKLFNKNLADFLKNENLDILFRPLQRSEVSIGNFNDFANVKIEMEIGLRPEINVNFDAAKNLLDYKILANEEDIHAQALSVRKRFGKFSSAQVIEEDDMLLLTVVPPEGNEFMSSLMFDYLKEDARKDFIGKNLHDEMDIDTTRIFKGDYERATFLKIKVGELEKAPSNVHIKIDAIHHVEIAELNADFFAQAYPDGSITDEAGFLQDLKEQTEFIFQRKYASHYTNKVMDALLKATPIELPEEFLKKYLEEDQEIGTESIDEIYPNFKERLNYILLENQLAKDFDIQVHNDDIIEHVYHYLRRNYAFGATEVLSKEQEDMLYEQTAKMLETEDNAKTARGNVFFEKLTSELKNKLNPKVKELTVTDFLAEISGENKNTEKKKTKKAAKEDKTEEAKEEKSETPKEKKKETPKAKTTKPKKSSTNETSKENLTD